MKRILIVIGILLIFLACNKKDQEILVFNTEPATRFIGLMNYLEKKSPSGFDNKGLSLKTREEEYQKNLKDTVLKNKIDSLLGLPAYSVLSEITTVFIDTNKIHGKEAYRLAFLNLPYNIVSMSGGLSESWVDFWKTGKSDNALKFINSIISQSGTVSKNTIKYAKEFLPSDLNDPRKIETVFCADGNRGSFTIDEKIYMDLLDFDNYNLDRFTKILAHEYHHVIYEKWLDDYNPTGRTDEAKKAVFDFQKGIIMEGLAQQINYDDYSQQIMDLYNNKDLIKKLQENWMNTFKKIIHSEDPLDTFETESDKMWGNSIPLLKKYSTGKIEEETYPHRPSTLYYLGYHLYHTILKNGGKKELEYAITHPDQVLEIYNKVRNKESVMPEFPQDIVKLWKDSFKTE